MTKLKLLASRLGTGRSRVAYAQFLVGRYVSLWLLILLVGCITRVYDILETRAVKRMGGASLFEKKKEGGPCDHLTLP